jgi:uncharacterized BrkB/YihY/UPF0761 family membrane protein
MTRNRTELRPQRTSLIHQRAVAAALVVLAFVGTVAICMTWGMSRAATTAAIGVAGTVPLTGLWLVLTMTELANLNARNG